MIISETLDHRQVMTWIGPHKRDRYPTASFLGEHRVVFNIKGEIIPDLLPTIDRSLRSLWDMRGHRGIR